jgi:hypothetical protein
MPLMGQPSTVQAAAAALSGGVMVSSQMTQQLHISHVLDRRNQMQTECSQTIDYASRHTISGRTRS